MPSWNIHTAHVERLVSDCPAHDLGIEDVNAFLFGNYVPDIYVGFMVPDASMHIDYCMTHWANVGLIPIPDADKFWDMYIYKRRSKTPSGVSLALGAWAHLVADRFYNGTFLTFLETHDAPMGEELRIRKQGDFDVFGHTLGISSCVQVNSELLEAAKKFRGYSILPQDVEKSVEVAASIVRASGSGKSRVSAAKCRVVDRSVRSVQRASCAMARSVASARRRRQKGICRRHQSATGPSPSSSGFVSEPWTSGGAFRLVLHSNALSA